MGQATETKVSQGKPIREGVETFLRFFKALRKVNVKQKEVSLCLQW